MGRRIFKKVYSGETLEKHLRFVYDGYKLIEEKDALNSNALVRRYVWQPESLDRDVPLTVYDASTEKTYYYHTDANKNVTELSDENGEVVAHYEYSPFGSLTKTTAAYAASNPFRFSSEYFDEETGLVYYNYRYYNPELGRWISRDPIEEQGGYNLYGMIGNNPLLGWDDLGYAVDTIWDICNICMGIASMVNNISAENYDEAAGDAIGVIADTIAAAVPFVPGGASMARQSVKAANKTIDAAKTRNAAYREAKRANDIPVSQQPTHVGANIDRRGKSQPGKTYEFDTPTGRKTIRDDSNGHVFSDDPSQNRGPHFNDDQGIHYDYKK